MAELKEKVANVKLEDHDIKELNDKFEKLKRRNLESMQKRIDKIESTMAKSVKVNTPQLLDRINKIAASYEKFQVRIKEAKKMAEIKKKQRILLKQIRF